MFHESVVNRVTLGGPRDPPRPVGGRRGTKCLLLCPSLLMHSTDQDPPTTPSRPDLKPEVFRFHEDSRGDPLILSTTKDGFEAGVVLVQVCASTL